MLLGKHKGGVAVLASMGVVVELHMMLTQIFRNPYYQLTQVMRTMQ